MWYKRFLVASIFLILALVLSLAGGGLALNRPSLANSGIPLEVSFVEPTPDEFTCIPVCTNFIVKLNIKNITEYQTGHVGAGILLDQSKVELLPGQEAGPSVDDIPPGESWTPSWTLHCKGAGPTLIMFQISASDLYYDTSAVRTIYQGKPHLKVIVTEPKDGVVYTPCTNFLVKATVENAGDYTFYEPTVTIKIDGPASLVGDTETKGIGEECPMQAGIGVTATVPFMPLICIQPEESYNVSWNLHCDGPGDAIITVNPDGSIWATNGAAIPNNQHNNTEYNENSVHEPICEVDLESDSIVIHQVSTPPSPASSPCSQNLPTCPCHYQGVKITPEEVFAGQPVTVAVNVVNPCEGTGDYSVALRVNGRVEESRMISVGGNTAAPTRFTIVKNEPGTYTVDIGDQKASFTVVDSNAGGSGGSKATIPIIIAFCVLAIIVVGLVLIIYRRPA